LILQKCALQLHTLREECKEDFPNVLRELKKMGWVGVQFAGYHDYEPAELAEVMSETGLKTAGLHVKLKQVSEGLDQLIAEAKLFHTRDLIMSSTPASLKNASGYTKVKRILNEAGKRLQLEDMRISYHNHAFEFETEVEGINALEYLLEPSPDNRIMAEPDVYWVKKGGKDPLTFISQYSGRMPIIHLKDMSTDAEQTFAEIGEGSIDFKPIIKWGESNGSKPRDQMVTF
jgi:sugar phosphate isomerase/epimerase